MSARNHLLKEIYSDKLDGNLQSQVRALMPVTPQSFRSSVTRSDLTKVLEWREARFNAFTQSWNVYTNNAYTAEAEGEDDDIKSVLLLENACFFDALHAVATFDAGMEGQVVAAENTLPDYILHPHHRSIAEKVGIPYDRENMPLPAADGNILTEGNYSAGARKAALASATSLTVQKAQVPAPVFKDIVPEHKAALPALRNIEAVARNIEAAAALERSYGQAIKAVQAGPKNLKYAIEDNFKLISSDIKDSPLAPTGLFVVGSTAIGAGSFGSALALSPFLPSAAATMASVGSGGLIMACVGGVAFGFLAMIGIGIVDWRSPALINGKTIKNLQSLARTLPEGSDLRRDVEMFGDEIKLADQALRARFAFERASKNPRGLGALRSEMKKLEKLCAKLNVSPEQIAWLSHAIQEDPKSKSLRIKLMDHVQMRSAALQEKFQSEIMGKKSVPVAPLPGIAGPKPGY